MDVMDNATKLSFLWRLVRGTENEKIRWVERAECEFACTIGPFYYAIASEDNDDLAPFTFAIGQLAGDAEVIEPVEEWRTTSHGTLNDALQALYLAVKLRVTGKLQTAAAMFESLAEIDGESPSPQVDTDDSF